MNHAINIAILVVGYILLNRLIRFLDERFHKIYYKPNYRITVWTAITDRATYRLSLSRHSNTYVLQRMSLKWSFERNIMSSYFANLHMQNQMMNKENMLVYSEHIIEDVVKHINEHYGESIIVSRTEN